jgi:GTPase SAR1 family protein
LASIMLQGFITVHMDSSSPSILCRSRKFVGILLGLRVIDALFPVSQGQRELIIGDRQTGKSSIAVSCVHNQVYRNGSSSPRKWLLAMLVSVGQRIGSLLKFGTLLAANGCMSFCTGLLASVTATMTAQFAGPLAGTAVCELSRNVGRHATVTYDDLSKHAIAYRQLCLYLRKPAGREAFPSDVFYLHARVLERSCCLAISQGYGTLMSLPVIETLSNDLSAYIATNVVSITDGQLYLDVGLFGAGQLPAVSTDKSVSRVGAKSLDALLRASGFRVYALLGAAKQEDGTASDAGARARRVRVSCIVASFVQRSANDRVDSTLLLMAVASGLLDALPTVLTKLLLVVAHYDTTESYLMPAVGLWTAGIAASSAVAARGIWSVAGRLTATVYVLSSVLGAAATVSPSVREVLAAIG